MRFKILGKKLSTTLLIALGLLPRCIDTSKHCLIEAWFTRTAKTDRLGKKMDGEMGMFQSYLFDGRKKTDRFWLSLTHYVKYKSCKRVLGIFASFCIHHILSIPPCVVVVADS
jgi:hypothetical protein